MEKIADEVAVGMNMDAGGDPVQAADLLKTELQDNAGNLRHLRHFPQDTAGYCPDDSNSVVAGSSAAAAVVAVAVVAAAAVAVVAVVAVDEVVAVANNI